MKKILKLIVAGIFVASLTSCLDFALPKAPPFKIASTSPQGTYAIVIERRQNKPVENDRATWKVFLSLSNKGQQVLNEVEVGSGNESSGGRYSNNPKLNWVHENTFRLSEQASLPESESDVLLIRNDSTSVVSYLTVNGGWRERFFTLN